ncbi:MAG TPA: hypothetical protein VEQ15_08245 [Myxococcales bacterium]|nr:hypothetical protein [Myxococcales bacterium]
MPPQDLRDRLERRPRALRLDETRVQDAAVGVVEHHHQVLPRKTGDPLVRRRVEVEHHPHQRPPLALAPADLVDGGLRHPFLSRETRPSVHQPRLAEDLQTVP